MIATRLDAGLMERLAEVRGLCPEMRTGQFLATVGLLAADEQAIHFGRRRIPSSPPPWSVLASTSRVAARTRSD